MQSNKLHTDFQLIDLALNGDNKSFTELVSRHKAIVASTAMNMLGDMEEANEIGQQTFIRFYKSMGSFKKKSKLSTYLTKITMNLCLNHLKRNQTFLNRSIPLDQAQFIQSADDTSKTDAKEIINLALQRLDEKHRSIVVLRMIQGYDTKQTAAILEIPKGTVLSRLTRAMSKLKSILKEEFNYE